jgi:hypothetical protein
MLIAVGVVVVCPLPIYWCLVSWLSGRWKEGTACMPPFLYYLISMFWLETHSNKHLQT